MFLTKLRGHPVGQRDFPEFHSPGPSDRRPSAVAVAVAAAAVIAIHNSDNDAATAIRARRGEREGEGGEATVNHFSSARPFDELQSVVSAGAGPQGYGKHVSLRSDERRQPPPPPHDRQHD